MHLSDCSKINNIRIVQLVNPVRAWARVTVGVPCVCPRCSSSLAGWRETQYKVGVECVVLIINYIHFDNPHVPYGLYCKLGIA